jgi:hypothetical protein
MLYRITPCIHKSATQGAATTIFACLQTGLADSPDTNGQFYMGLGVATKIACDDETAQAVWAATEALTGLS